ncbi:MAG: energy transducer TonB [Acidobacteriota bacterium]
MFEQLLASGPQTKTRKPLTLTVSLAVHATVLVALAVIPLVFPKAAELPAIRSSFGQLLISERDRRQAPPKPPRRSAGAGNRPAVPGSTQPPVFVEPSEIPEEIPSGPGQKQVDVSGVIIGGEGVVPGLGRPGYPEGGDDSSTWSGLRNAAMPPRLREVEKRKPIHVPSTLQAAKLTHRVDPEYPQLAKQARISGVVVVQVTIDERGNVATIRVVRGHALLDDAAVTAVRQWRYSPTYLNGQAVPVMATVTVQFVLR